MTEQMSLEVFDPLKAAIAELQQKDESQEFDHTTPDGEKALRSWVRRVRNCKGDIEKVRKATKADALAFGRKVDEMARELTIVPESIIAERMKPLDEIEAKKRADAEAVLEAERLAEEKAEADRVADLERREAIADKKEAEFKAKEYAIKADQEAKERAEREKQIAIAAAEKAKKEAEEKAERDQEVAEANARFKKQKEEAAEKRRVENKKHQESIEDDIYTALLPFVDVGPCASAIVAHMKNGKIPHVTINY